MLILLPARSWSIEGNKKIFFFKKMYNFCNTFIFIASLYIDGRLAAAQRETWKGEKVMDNVITALGQLALLRIILSIIF